MAACGGIETVMTLYMMQDGFIAPTLNLEEIDERCAMVNHVQKLVEQPVKTAAIQNFAFGGVNTSLLIRKLD
jgi:3-oxoacyl-[acyl-carrier-protein] synthase II